MCASRPSDTVRRDRCIPPPSSHHVSTSSGQVVWKPPPIGNRSRSGRTKGDSIFTVWLALVIGMDLAQICCETLGCEIADVGKQEFFLHSGVNLGYWSLVEVCRRGDT